MRVSRFSWINAPQIATSFWLIYRVLKSWFQQFFFPAFSWKNDRRESWKSLFYHFHWSHSKISKNPNSLIWFSLSPDYILIKFIFSSSSSSNNQNSPFQPSWFPSCCLNMWCSFLPEAFFICFPHLHCPFPSPPAIKTPSIHWVLLTSALSFPARSNPHRAPPPLFWWNLSLLHSLYQLTLFSGTWLFLRESYCI